MSLVKEWRCFDRLGMRALTFLRRDLKRLVDRVESPWKGGMHGGKKPLHITSVGGRNLVYMP